MLKFAKDRCKSSPYSGLAYARENKIRCLARPTVHIKSNWERALTISVMILSTQFFPVRGSLHSSKILCLPPLAVCSIVTMTFVPAAETRSIAPPMPLTILPCIEECLVTRKAFKEIVNHLLKLVRGLFYGVSVHRDEKHESLSVCKTKTWRQ